MTPTAQPNDDDIALAGEYVLRLLDPAEAREVELRLASEPGLVAAVADWEDHLVGLADEVPSVAPPARLRRAVMETLFDEGSGAAGPVASAWRWLTGLGLVAATLLALYVLPGQPERAGPILVTEIAAEDGSLAVVTQVVLGEGQILVARRAGAAPAGRVLELWHIIGDNAPVSLGVLPDDPTARVAITPGDPVENWANTVLAISEEPPGGSPTGSPTLVRATGDLPEA